MLVMTNRKIPFILIVTSIRIFFCIVDQIPYQFSLSSR